MIKTLSLLLTDERRDAAPLRAAAAIAEREGAHLDIVGLGLEPIPLETMPMAAAQIIVESGHAEAQDQARSLTDWAKARLPADLRFSCEPRTVMGLNIGALAARLARYSDLTVVPRPYGPGCDSVAAAVAEALLFGSGAPVLVVPDREVDWSRPFRRIALAWNGTDESMRATRAALPFLTAAESVHVAIIDPPLHAADRSDPGGELSQWLSRHGVRTEVAVLAKTQPRVADILARFASEKGCDALVMGAYGHSRLREAMLGGATRDMLSQVPLPLIMSH
ncbi:universal stress protein [Rubellimicrobium aerolatum]|uniref:Universal stress protein n=1 Tax=Rubellimicrobium aerolatum TaxID=490979 RepID=A0ABW0SFH8_9RHOB|nr:universal stress protein [Rubellimicrobium aerolatum]MBP1807255.1 nucleotide-binding universal stress UspA family protein [Rubellimicrobium aerolatum]